MGELILHIGLPKTGTSSLQRFFFLNRKQLTDHGVAFPVFTRQPEKPQVINGDFLNRHCSNLAKGMKPYSRINDFEANIKRLSECLATRDRTLLTDECFSLYASRLIGGKCSPQPYWPILARLASECGANAVTIVIYLRRQDDWIASHWRQAVKDGFQGKDITDYSKMRYTSLVANYANMLEAAERAFCRSARIVVRRYDRNAFKGGTIYQDFCNACDIPWSKRYRTPRSEENYSLSFDVAEALRLFKEVAPPNSPLRTNVLTPLAARLSSMNPDAPGTTPFSEDATCELMDPYLAGNQRIAEAYFDGSPLFSNEYGGRPIWVPNEERIAENRSAFEQAIEKHASRPVSMATIHGIARAMPESIRYPLKLVQARLFNK